MMKDELNNTEEYGEVAELLGRLERVHAPADFDFRVKARIASGRPAAAGLFGIPAAARYAALLAVLLVVSGTAGYYVLDMGKSDVAVNPVILPAERPVLPNDLFSNTDRAHAEPPPADQRPDPNGAVNVPTGERDASIVRPQTNSAETGGGSIDQAANVGRRIMPPGINPSGVRPANPEGFINNSRIPARDVLQTLGVNVRIEGNAWKVESVSENSTAARVGLQSGDIVEAINDQKITISSSIKNPFTAKTMRVIRDGKAVSIDLAKP